MADTTRQEHQEGFTITEHAGERDLSPASVTVVSHSNLFYWWPVWVVGFIFAGITRFYGETVAIGNAEPDRILASNGPGLIFIAVTLFSLLVTTAVVRGLASAVVVLTILFLSVLFAWLGWWDDIIEFLPELRVRMNFGFYMLFSTLVLIFWLLAFFVFDRLSYWRISAGQVTQEHLIGGGEQSYDTIGLRFEEFHDDLFRHWILGFGAGDLKMTVRNEEFVLRNVLFANQKVKKIQELIKRKPE